MRWALDKLKDETAAGRIAQGTATLWILLDWMLQVLPASRSAPHLRDAIFPAILERTLFDQFGKLERAPTSDDVEMSDASGSTEVIGEGTKPSKKRKRGAVGANGTNSHALGPSELQKLFLTIKTVIQSIVGLTIAQGQGEDAVQAELMKVVLRAESAQAASILKNWLIAVEKLPAMALSSGNQHLTGLLDLSLVVDIWELRTVAASDETGSSADEFSTECLVPALTLLNSLRVLRSVNPDQSVTSSIDCATQTVEKLLARHLFAPARIAFFAGTEKTMESTSKYREAALLANNLSPLRAKLLQAAQIEDDGESVPADLSALSGASSQLLDLAIRISPSRTPRSRLAEKPWIEAVFVALVECAGCSLTTPPQFVTSKTAIKVLVHAINVLQAHSVSIKADISKDLFWYHSGIKYPIGKDKQMHWSLVSALIELDPTVFVTEPRGLTGSSKALQTDLAQVIFEEISKAQLEGPGFAEHDELSKQELASKEASRTHVQSQIGRTTVLERVVVPLMSGFAKNRNLVGFLRRWDDQLVKSYRHENRKSLKDCKDLIWEDRAISQALSRHFEQSLTQSQIANLLQEHIQRIDDLGGALTTEAKQDVNVKKLAAYKKAASTAIIVPAVLQSIVSDEAIEALKSQLRSLLQSYSVWVQDDRYSFHMRLSFSWLTLCQLVSKLWPVGLHSSIEQQEELLSPLIEQSLNDVSTVSKGQTNRRIDSPTRAAAMLFLLGTCDHLQTLPGSEDLIRPSLDKILWVLSSRLLDSTEHVKIVEIFCTDFIQLFGYLETSASQQSLRLLLAAVSTLNDETSNVASKSLAQVIFEQGSSALEDAYVAALLELVQHDDNRVQQLVISSLNFIRPTAISRDRREAVLNRLTELIASGPQDAAGVLSIMVQLMEASNATAKISSDGTVLFDIAMQLSKQHLESPTILQLLQQLAQLTLSQIVSNQSQSQNMIYLGKFKGKLDSIVSKGKQCSAANLALLRAVVAVQKQNSLLQLKQYVSVLKTCLADDSLKDDAAFLRNVIDAFNELPTATLAEAKLMDSTQTWLRSWIKENADLDSYMVTGGQGPTGLAEYIVRLHTTVAKFKLYPNTKWLVDFTLKCLREPVAEQFKISTMATVKEVFAQLPVFEKLDLVHVLTNVESGPDLAASYRILNTLISTFEDRYESNIELKNNQLALLPKLCGLLTNTPDHTSFNALLSSINTILSHTPSFATQHSIESTLSALSTLTSRSSPPLSAAHAPAIYARLCETTRLVLLLHRGRLGGRFHILLPLLQNLLFLLFTPHSGRGSLPAWLRGPDALALMPTNGAQLSRVLSTLCNPPQSSIQKTHASQSKTSRTLNDPVRAAREKTSAFLYPLLASYCRFQLSGKLEAAVRDKVMPGIWEVVGTASLSRDGLDAMFAGLGRSERDVWRSVWGEWEGVHGRKDLLSGDVV